MNFGKQSRAWATAVGLVSLLANNVGAEESAPMAAPPTLQCLSTADMRQTCAGDTSAGVALVRSTGSQTCLLGKNWGYDDTGVWVMDGCGGEFVLGASSAAAVASEAPTPAGQAPESWPKQGDTRETETWGFLDPGKGFLLGKSDDGDRSRSAPMRWFVI